jgi:hypothetical protein
MARLVIQFGAERDLLVPDSQSDPYAGANLVDTAATSAHGAEGFDRRIGEWTGNVLARGQLFGKRVLDEDGIEVSIWVYVDDAKVRVDLLLRHAEFASHILD